MSSWNNNVLLNIVYPAPEEELGESDDGSYYGPNYENLDVDGNRMMVTPNATPSQSPDYAGSMQRPNSFFEVA